MSPLLTAHNLTKAFKGPWGSLSVISGVSLSLNTGESLSIRGESGSGKTTLLHVLAGLEAVDSGELFWEGESPLSRSLAWQAKRRGLFLGLVFQSYYLVPELNVLENVLLAKRLVGGLDKAAEARAEALLLKAGLQNRLKHLPHQLSGGERQRVAIARALINQPRLLLADEPTGNLDEKTAETVMELLLNLTADAGVGLILVTHNPEFAKRTQRQVVLHKGQLL